MRVIVIEVEIRIREGISKLLGKMGEKFDVVAEAEDGKAGLALCLEHKPDIIITDIRMPDMDGLEMLTVLKEQGVDFNAIVISAFSEFEYAKKAISLGVTEYLVLYPQFNIMGVLVVVNDSNQRTVITRFQHNIRNIFIKGKCAFQLFAVALTAAVIIIAEIDTH